MFISRTTYKLCTYILFSSGFVGGGAGLVSKYRKVHGLANISATYATNLSIVAACYCGNYFFFLMFRIFAYWSFSRDWICWMFFFFLKGDLLDVIVIVKSIANQRKIRALTTTSDDNLKILLAWFCPFAWWWLDQNRKFHLEQISQVSFSSSERTFMNDSTWHQCGDFLKSCSKLKSSTYCGRDGIGLFVSWEQGRNMGVEFGHSFSDTYFS